MGLVPKTNWVCLKELLVPVEQVLENDLEKLKRMEKTRRTDMWNNIVRNQQKFKDGKCGDIERDINEEIDGKFDLAKLLIATAAYDNKENSPIINEFNETEYNLVKEFERLAIFDVLSIDEIVEKIGRKEGGFYELIIKFYEKGYNKSDEILNDLTILRELKVSLKNRYMKIQNKIKEITIACIERYGFSIKQ